MLIYHEDSCIIDFFKIFENYSNIEILQSIKITKKSFNKDRYDINIPTYKISLDSLFKILNTLNFPNDKFQEIVKEYNQSEEVHFGIEKNKKQINYRVYFKRKISLSEWLSYKNLCEQTTVFYSFKWNSENNSNVLNTSYDICHNVDAKKMIEIIKTKISFLPKFLVKKIKEKSNPYVLFSVEDKNSPRKSFNIIHEPIVFWGLSSDIEKFFDIKFSEMFADLQNECFINFTGGIDKNNEDFITLYFELNKGS